MAYRPALGSLIQKTSGRVLLEAWVCSLVQYWSQGRAWMLTVISGCSSLKAAITSLYGSRALASQIT
ncbi:hypothetical protein D3C73_1352130 [compost metagenome]